MMTTNFLRFVDIKEVKENESQYYIMSLDIVFKLKEFLFEETENKFWDGIVFLQKNSRNINLFQLINVLWIKLCYK